MDKLLRIMEMLRDKQHGCPWDVEQSYTSLLRYTLEEVYEVVDAVENGTTEQLRDELGDLLFQVVFYAQIAREEDKFDFQDVADAISAKLLRRHPHVFPTGDVESFGQEQKLRPEEVVTNWEAIKKKERELAVYKNTENQKESVLKNIPVALPALERALKIQSRVSNVGFDWRSTAPVLEKLREEIDELERAMQENNPAAVTEELGDALFSLVNLARHLEVSPENALRAANQKFVNRFHYIEARLNQEQKAPGDVSLERLDEIWSDAKRKGL